MKMNLKCVVMVPHLVLLNFCGFVLVSGMPDVFVDLRGPRFVVHGHSATLSCEHNVNPEHLYKVVFYKNGQRIMKFVRGRDPPYVLYEQNLTGAVLNISSLSPTSITLERMDFAASGSYECEIALDSPLYSKVSKAHELNVIVRQKHRPRIKIKNKKSTSSHELEATCQSAPAYPAPHLAWFINNLKVDESQTTPYGVINSHRHHHGGVPLAMTNSSLHFPLATLQLFANQSIEITCLATIPSFAMMGEGFADAQNASVFVNVVRPIPTPTQVAVKIVSEDTSSSNTNKEFIILLFMTIICTLI